MNTTVDNKRANGFRRVTRTPAKQDNSDSLRAHVGRISVGEGLFVLNEDYLVASCRTTASYVRNENGANLIVLTMMQDGELGAGIFNLPSPTPLRQIRGR